MPWYGWVMMFCFYTGCHTVTMATLILANKRTTRRINMGQPRRGVGRMDRVGG